MVLKGALLAWRPLLRWGAGVGVAALLATGGALARSGDVGAVAIGELPVEAQAVHRAVRSGGPFAYPKDGIVFGNRERILPAEPRGWYREYPVATPGARDRGARRLVCGGPAPTSPRACWYTNAHYSTFSRITP